MRADHVFSACPLPSRRSNARRPTHIGQRVIGSYQNRSGFLVARRARVVTSLVARSSTNKREASALLAGAVTIFALVGKDCFKLARRERARGVIFGGFNTDIVGVARPIYCASTLRCGRA